jgi:membrane protease YdiL (CAAX protease family)
MPPQGPNLNPWHLAIGYLMLAALAGSLGAWAWAIRRVIRHEPLVEEPTPRVPPWGALSVAAVVMLYLGLQLGAGSLYGLGARLGLLGPLPEGAKLGELPKTDLLRLMLLINLAIVALVPVLLHWTSRARAEDFGLAGAEVVGRDLRRGFVACLLLMPVVYGAFAAAQLIWKPIAHPVFDVMHDQATGPNAVVVILSAVLAAPAAEELLFRGVLLGWLTRAASLNPDRTGPESAPAVEPMAAEAEPPVWLVREELRGERSVWAPPQAPPTDRPVEAPPDPSRPAMAYRGLAAWVPNVFVSILFAMLHAEQWPAPLPLFLLSLGLGWLYQRTGRLMAPLALHATFNGFSTLLLMLAVGSGEELPNQAPAPVPRPAEGVIWPRSARPGLEISGLAAPELTAPLGDLRSIQRDSGRAGTPDDPRIDSGGRGRRGIGDALTRGQTRGRPWTRKARRSSAISSRRPAAPAIPSAGPGRPVAT